MYRFVKRVFFAGSLIFGFLPSMVVNAMPVNVIDSTNKALFYQAIDMSQAKIEQLDSSYHAEKTDYAEKTDHAEKMDALSRVLLGAVYAGGSVGEGEQSKYDKDPLVRFDVFDCTTYIETILAGVMSASSAEFEANLMRWRYKDGNVSFVSRNHFPSLDWFHNNRDKLLDITPDVADGGAQVAKAVIDKTAWYQHIGSDVLRCDAALSDCQTLLSQLQSEGSAFTPELAYLPYVPLTELFIGRDKHTNQALLDRIPSGSVISMVRPDWPLKQWIGTNMNVSHQGIAIRKGGVLFLRHASLTHKKVMDENFAEYFSHYSTTTSSLKGFNVQIVRH